MKRLRNFFRRSPADRLLLVKSAMLLGMIGLGLFLLPFKVVLVRVDNVKPRKGLKHGIKAIPANRISWAVSKVSRYIPYTKCLAKALALKVLFTREGYQAKLCIGVDKCGNDQLKAHAWVESQGEIVIGNTDNLLSRFKVLPFLKSNKS